MIIIGDAKTELKKLSDQSVNCCVTSPPYFGLRDYGHAGQLGLEKTPGEYVKNLVDVFREVKRVLRDDGTLWLNLGDSYTAQKGQRKTTDKAGCKQNSLRGSTDAPSRYIKDIPPKNLIGIPWRVAFALQADGWHLRQDIIWSKPNPMPESVKDRCTKSHEYIFLLSKSPKYYFDHEAIKEIAAYPNGPNSPQSIKSPYGQGFTRANSFKRKTATEGKPGSPNQHREDREDVEYSGTRNKRSVWTVEDHNSLIQWLSETNPELFNQYLSSRPDVWNVSTKPYIGAHFATFPPELITPCILAGCPEGGIVVDPFFGSGTVGEVAIGANRDYIGIELNSYYEPLINERCNPNQIRF